MKKIIVYIGIFLMAMGCQDVLDIKPTNMISEDAVKEDPVLVDAFLNKIYVNTRFRSGSTYSPDQALLHVMSGEANVFAAWQVPFNAAMKIIDENGAHDQAEYWPYGNIRSANEIIQILEEATFDEQMVQQKTAEARWLRAFMYFELVKRYGGVPLITEPQSIEQPIEELYVERNSEKEIYDFIATEMDELVNILPSEYGSESFGRPTKWAAYALKSRAMLYAGSIAKYGSVQLNGILGIPANEAGSYYQKAYEASMEVINNSPHQLFKKYADPVQNYNRLFIEDGNSEVIFAEVYDLGLLKTHAWNHVSMPDGFNAGWGSNNWLYLESVEKYEYQDGSSGKLDWSKFTPQNKFSLEDLILKKDPRFLASCFYQEIPWQGGVVYSHTNTIGTIPAGSDWPKVAPNRNRIKTGFLIRKRVDENILRPISGEDETDWILFRAGEMYLNAAEAAFERGETDEAKRLINIIRDRAGMPDKETLTVEDIRNERFVELYIEEHRYWDLRRWRIAVEELNGKGFNGVRWVYHIDEDKYTLQLVGADFNQIRTFAERNYYFPIGLSRLADNPNLVENPGY
ncbi:MAG: RagB/SusD family nutrient uptake outer membrane protein [Mariniphaga sp.]|jgi:hypothetical protein|nr:RagB/SusD family nutrient uptake outer membrane protein [Mariniphaga sp.]